MGSFVVHVKWESQSWIMGLGLWMGGAAARRRAVWYGFGIDRAAWLICSGVVGFLHEARSLPRRSCLPDWRFVGVGPR